MGRRACFLAIVATASFCNVSRLMFVPAVSKPQSHGIPPACVASVLGAIGVASTAHADAIDDAAKKLAAAAYPFVQEVPWNSDVYSSLPGSNPALIGKALEKVWLLGGAMDAGALKAGALAHSKAINAMDAKGVCPLEDFEAICAAIGHMIASAPAEKTMDVYNAFAPLVDKAIPDYLVGTVNAADANTAYQALMEFKDVVKAGR